MKGDMSKAGRTAHEEFTRDVVKGMRRKRLAKMLKPKVAEKKDPDDLGGYEELESMYEAKDEKKK